MTPETLPTYLEYAGQECKIMIRKAWKAGLEGGSWATLPFAWTSLSEQERALVTLPNEGLTPFALVGPAVWSSTDFSTVIADSRSFVFVHDDDRIVYVLEGSHKDGHYKTAVLLDDVVFKLAKPPKKKR